MRVLPGCSGVNVGNICGTELAPVHDRIRCHFCSVVHAHEFGGAMNSDQAFENVDDVIAGHGPLNFNGKGRFGEFVGDVEVFQCSPVTRLIELKIERPHVIGTHCYVTFTWIGGVTVTPTFPLFHLHP